MSVYQVEEYYVYVSLTAKQKQEFEQDIRDHLELKYIENYEVSEHGVTVDGFESESEALDISFEIEEIIS